MDLYVVAQLDLPLKMTLNGLQSIIIVHWVNKSITMCCMNPKKWVKLYEGLAFFFYLGGQLICAVNLYVIIYGIN